MAYKFQLGAFKASGSIEALEGFDANSQAIVSASSVATDAFATDQGSEILSYSPVRMSGSTKIQFGGASDTMGIEAGVLEIAGGGDISISATSGDVDIALHNGTNGLKLGGTLVTATAAELNILDGVTADSTELNNLDGFADAAYAAANDSIVFLDSDGGIRSERHNDFVDTLIGDGIERNGSNLQVKKATDGALTFVGASSDELSVQLSGSSLSKNANGLSLSDTIPGARTFSDNVIIQGNLSVEGTTVTVDSTTIAITGSIQFEGATGDGFETTLGVVDPTADRSIDLPNAGGNVAVFSDSSFQTAAVRTTVTELELLDGDTSVGSSITIADTDGFIINDGSTMKLIPASDIKDYASAAVALSVASKADGDTLATGMNYFAALSADATVTLPASPSVGDLIYVKANSFSNGAGIIVNRAGSQTIDGQTALLLESDYAAVTLVYVASNDWRIV